MTPEMHNTLHRISLLHSIQPEVVFNAITEEVAAYYGSAEAPTMAMINLVDGSCIRFHTVTNKHRIFRRRDSTDLDQTLCSLAVKNNVPLLIQNASDDPDYCRHLVVSLKLRRYLGVPICNPGGKPIGTLCLLDDRVGDSLGEEDARFLSFLAMRAGAELERGRLMEEQLETHRSYVRKLEETAAEKRRFVSMVVHDLRHPLAAMMLSLGLLHTEIGSEASLEHVEALQNRTRALATLLDEILEYDKVESGSPMLKLEDVDLARLVTNCVEEISGDHPVPVVCEIARELGIARTDGRKLRHIVANLVANALKYTSQGHVTVRAMSQNSDDWRLEVEDTGVGMNEEERRLVFDNCLAGAPGAARQSGLGLTITCSLARALGAKLNCSSVPGSGTIFSIDFPRNISLLAVTEYAN